MLQLLIYSQRLAFECWTARVYVRYPRTCCINFILSAVRIAFGCLWSRPPGKMGINIREAVSRGRESIPGITDSHNSAVSHSLDCFVSLICHPSTWLTLSLQDPKWACLGNNNCSADNTCLFYSLTHIDRWAHKTEYKRWGIQPWSKYCISIKGK